MDIVVTGRHTTVSDRFRQHIAEKLDKVQQLAPRTRRIEVVDQPRSRTADSPRPVTAWRSRVTSRARSCAPKRARRTSTPRSTSPSRSSSSACAASTTARVRRGRHTRRSRSRPRRPSSRRSPRPDDAAARGRRWRLRRLADRGPREGPHLRADDARPGAARDGARRPRLLPLPRPETDKASVVYRRRGWSYGVLHLDLNGRHPVADPTDPWTRLDADTDGARRRRRDLGRLAERGCPILGRGRTRRVKMTA